MVTVLRCPSCGAPVQQGLLACPFCNVAFARPGPSVPVIASPENQSHDVPAEVVLELRSGNKIGAIKAYHVASKCSLKQAKDFVDRLERELGLG